MPAYPVFLSEHEEGIQTAMQVTAEQTDPCVVTLDISLDEGQVARTFDSVYREFSRYVSVPGFRPGKAPRAILERYVDQERVRERAKEKLISDSYFKAIEQEGITPYRDPEIDTTDIEDHKPYTFKAAIPLEPQVTLGDYTGLTVEKPIFSVTEAMVEERVNRLREDRARLERITDRGVQEGDVLIAENQVVMEGEEPNGPARRQLIQIGNNIPGFDEAVMGMKPDEERTFTLTYPDDYDEEEKRGKQATFTVRLSSISARRLPELDDAFARQVAGVETVDDLRQTLRQQLEAQAANLSDQIAEQRLLQEIIGRSEIHFPPVLVREEVQDRLRQLLHDLRQAQIAYEAYLAQVGKTAEQHQSELAAHADLQIRTLLALRDIARQEDLQASEKAIDAEFDRMLQEGRITEDQFEEYSRDPRRRLQVANALIQQKLHDFLFANNTLREVAQETPPDAHALEEANAEAEGTE
jgi:trigger factor